MINASDSHARASLSPGATNHPGIAAPCSPVVAIDETQSDQWNSAYELHP
jgi:hypothetical protein